MKIRDRPLLQVERSSEKRKGEPKFAHFLWPHLLQVERSLKKNGRTEVRPFPCCCHDFRFLPFGFLRCLDYGAGAMTSRYL